ncbi:MAG TPA: YCF48-related protein [Bryobacteraceae bacterium]|nr:YCF48-related protein [Bryobacteraceae bacterium]
MFRRLALRQGQSVDHPDAETLAAFGEQQLNKHERGIVLAHLAQCPECRDVLTLSSLRDEPVEFPEPERIGRRRWRHLRWAVPLAVACLLISIVRIPSPVRKPPPQLPAPAPHASSQQVAAVHNYPEATKAPVEIRAQRMRRKAREIHLPPRASESPAATVEQPAPEPPPNIIEPAMEAKAAATSIPIEKRDAMAGAFLPQQNIQQDVAPSPVPRPITVQAMSRSFLTRSLIVQRAKSLWRLDVAPVDVADAKGTIQKSSDGGRTWQSIHVSDYARFYALSANGPNVWVGGTSSALFHSADDGLHWTPVIVGDGEVRLSGTITGIEDLGGNSIRLKVQSEVAWVTSDGGLHWRRE